MTASQFPSTFRGRAPQLAPSSLLTLFLLLAGASAEAQTCPPGTVALLSQLPDYTNGFKSDATGNPQIVAENVNLTQAASLVSVTLWGGFGPGNTPSNDFTLIIHEDSAGLPGNVVHTEHGIATTLTPTGVIFPPPLVPLTEYRATLTPAAPVNLPAGLLWFEIYADGAGGDAWYWLTGSLDASSGSAGAAISFTAPGAAWFHFNPELALLICISEGGLQPDTLCFGDGSGTPCPCGNEAGPSGGCANSTGSGALLAASGSGSILGGDTTLHGSDLLPGQPALFFQADQSVNGGAGAAFGDGLRCCGQGVVRLQIVVPDANGDAASTIDIADAGGVSAGDERCYQLWYRDPSGSPCGTNFNLTNAVSFTWST